MGSGKTTVGRKLASLLGWSFTDLDKRIEEYSGKKIPELFSEYGEAYFRTIESEVLRSFENLSEIVISAGGGTPCHEDNIDFMLRTGLTIYLKLTPDQLVSRLVKSKTERPLIKGLSGKELGSFIEEKLASREKWYKQAEITIEGKDTDIAGLHSLVRSRFSF
jgi:shikimate kinase